MDRSKDPFVALAPETIEADVDGHEGFASLPAGSGLAPAVARLRGFDVAGHPLLGIPMVLKGEIVVARSTVRLRRSMIGRDMLVVFEANDPRRPIIVGVMEPTVGAQDTEQVAPTAAVQADGEQHIIEAEREVVLRCGAASITLTRAGKVIIKGSYILSRSTGYNKIKGAAIDLN